MAKASWKKLFKWEGFGKELIWIFFFFCLMFSVWGYLQDIGACRGMMESPCYQSCISSFIDTKNAEAKANATIFTINMSDYDNLIPNETNP